LSDCWEHMQLISSQARFSPQPWRVRVRPGTQSDADQSGPTAKISSFTFSITGRIPPEDTGNNWTQSATWPFEFAIEVDAHLDRSVLSTSASVEIIRETDAQRVARIVKPVDPSGGRVTIRRWRGVIERASIPEPGKHRIVIHIDGVEPEQLTWQFLRKQ
jgi:hypothetical protein